MEQLIKGMIDRIYPVGIIIEFDRSIDPNKTIGGKWERCLKGKVAVGVDESDTDFATVGKTGGEKAHKLTVAEMPSHNHYGAYGEKSDSANQNFAPYMLRVNLLTDQGKYNRTPTSTNGESKSHNNLQPYETVYKWKRTA